jgi:hypothetical protein
MGDERKRVCDDSKPGVHQTPLMERCYVDVAWPLPSRMVSFVPEPMELTSTDLPGGIRKIDLDTNVCDGDSVPARRRS